MSIFSPQTPLYSLQARGLWEGADIFYVVKGEQRIRSASNYDLGAKNHLIPFQAPFAAAVAAWKLLTDAKKKEYDDRALYLNKRYSGFNLYISMVLKGEALL